MSSIKMDDELKINAVMVLDIIGKPKEYLVESLEKHIANMEKEKGVSVKSKDIKTPELMKGQDIFYTTFAEVEIEVDEILILVGLMFKYMPAHVEILSPEMLGMTNGIFGEILNGLVGQLHGYDELARVMTSEKQTLIKKIQELGGEIPENVTPISILRNPFEEVGANGEQNETAPEKEEEAQEAKQEEEEKKKEG